MSVVRVADLMTRKCNTKTNSATLILTLPPVRMNIHDACATIIVTIVCWLDLKCVCVCVCVCVLHAVRACACMRVCVCGGCVCVCVCFVCVSRAHADMST